MLVKKKKNEHKNNLTLSNNEFNYERLYKNVSEIDRVG